jgi:hypothetical protein
LTRYRKLIYHNNNRQNETKNIQCVFSQTDNGYHHDCVKIQTSFIWT